MRLWNTVPRDKGRPAYQDGPPGAPSMGDERTVIVVGAGERPPDHLKEEAKGARLLGVDQGAQWILRWGLVPERVIGDLDSLDKRTRDYTDSYGAPILQTDDELTRADLARVVDTLIDERPPRVVFTGCVGNRLDHILALFGGMARLAASGVETHLVERWGSGHVATPQHRVELEDLAGEQASFFPLSPEVTGLRLAGFDAGEEPPTRIGWPADHLVGVRIVSDPAEAEVETGALLVLVPRREGADGERARNQGGKPTFRLGTLERTE